MNKVVSSWLAEVSKSVKRDPRVVAWNIGLFQSDGYFKAYIVGSFSYDPDDDDWACYEDLVPAHKYQDLPLDNSKMDWKIVRKMTIKAVSRFLDLGGPEAELFENSVITCGFDDGSLTVVRDSQNRTKKTLTTVRSPKRTGV